MGSKKIEVSRLGLTVSSNIRAQLGIRRMSNRELARQMGRSEGYVRTRVNDEKEWSLNDLEIISQIWGLQPSQLVKPAEATLALGTSSPAVPTREELEAQAAHEQERIQATLQRLHDDPMGLAAYEDPHKFDPDPDNIA